MFDGQNVFFDEDATFGKSWGVADYLDYTDTPLIVAAVECNAGANNERLVEYSPYRFDDPQFGHFDGTGQATMRDRKSTRLNSSHSDRSRMPSSA